MARRRTSQGLSAAELQRIEEETNAIFAPTLPTPAAIVTGPTGPTTVTGPTGPTPTKGTGSTGSTGPANSGGRKVVSTYTDPNTGDIVAVYDDGSSAILTRGTKGQEAATAKLKAEQDAKDKEEERRRQGQSAWNILFGEFDRYGMGALLNDVKEFITQGLSRDELILKLRATPAYEKRFAANAQRIKNGLRALSEAEYIGLEDQYQDIMRRYGLPASYYTRGDMGRQEGFEKFISGDVSPVELEDRIQTAQRRVQNAPSQIKDALTQYYGSEINNGDILAFTLDPQRAIEEIKRKVTAAEIGGAAAMSGLAASRARAEELGRYGITGEQARERFQTVAEITPRGSQLAEIYKQTPYTQETAEQEVFGLTGATEASKRRRKLAELETAAFSGTSGMAGGALARDRAGAF